MRRHQVGECLVKAESEEIYRLEYFIIENEELLRDKTTYGIEIIKTGIDSMEENRVQDITTIEEKIKSISEKLITNKVFPIHLQDVIENLI